MLKLRGIAAGALSGVLGALAFPPPGWSALAFVCLVPLVVHVRDRKGEGTALPFFVFGTVYFSIGLFWLAPVLTWVGPLLLAPLLSFLYVLPAGLVVGYLHRRGFSLLAVVPLAFLVFEWLRTFLFTGFPWLELAHSQAGWTTLVQFADLFGDHGVTAVLVFTNVAVAEALVLLRPRPLSALFRLSAAAALLGAVLAYGAIRLGTVAETPGPTVLLVQGNIPLYMKHEALNAPDPEVQTTRYIFEKYLEGTRFGVARHPEADVVIWPETMFPYRVTAAPGAGAEAIRKGTARAFAVMSRAAGGRPLIVGGHYRTGKDERQNAAFLIDGKGRLFPEHYAKVHAVPGGEYIPFRTVAPDSLVDAVKEMIREQAGFRPEVVEGEAPVLFTVDGVRYAPLICYEICYPQLVRAVRRMDADVVLNLTNYGWFPGTHQPEQANQIAVFRAVESRIPVVVAANTGISAVISPRGETKEIDVGGVAKEIEGVLAAPVPLTDARPPSLFLGDFPFLLAALLLLAGLLRGAFCRILGSEREVRS